MTKNISYYENIFDNISEVILLMEGQFFIYANLSALTLFEVESKEELYLLHPSQLSPQYQPDGELSSTEANKNIEFCYKNGEHSFEWLIKSFKDKTFLTEVHIKRIILDDKEVLLHTIKNIEPIKNLEKEQKNKNLNLSKKRVIFKKLMKLYC